MLRSFVVIAALGLAFPVLAQPSPDPEESEKEKARSPLAITGTGGDAEKGRKFWFSMSLKPEIVSDRPFADDSPATDSTEVSWRLGTTRKLSRTLTLDVEAGPSVVVDSDEDAEDKSNVGGSAKLSADLGLIAPFASYGIERGYTEFFDDASGTSHLVELGATLKDKWWVVDGKMDVAARLVESTTALEDYRAIRVKPKLTVEVIRKSVSISLYAEGQRRWYSHIHPEIGKRRRDWSFTGFAGFDITGAFNRSLNLPAGQHVFNDVMIGAVWVDNESNLDSKDKSNFGFKPAIGLKVYF